MFEPSYQNANSTLFESSYKEIWRKLIPEGLTGTEADFIEELAGLKPGHCLLDIMCGFGRHSIELARRGYPVTAVDNLPDYINEIKVAAQKERLFIQTVLEDVSSAVFPGTYDAAICMGNCFTSFDRENTSRILKNLAACLKPGGVFIINSWMIAEIAIKHFEARTWLYVDSYKYLLDNRYLLNPSRIETDHILIDESGQTQILKSLDYIFTFSELETILNEAGFRTKEVYSTPRKRKYQFGDNKAYLVAVKV